MVKYLILIALAFEMLVSCGENHSAESKEVIDFPQIRQRGKLIAITGYNAYSYFIYKGQPMGFEYDLLRRLGEHLNLDVDIIVEKNLDSMFAKLQRGEGDLIAFNLTVTNKRKKFISFTSAFSVTTQVLVQRKPIGWRKLKAHEIERRLITNVLDLDGDTVYVKANSAHAARLKHLSEEIGGKITVVEVGEDISQEDLMEKVLNGEIKFTVADKEIAKLYAAWHPALDIKLELSLRQRIAWAVRKTSDSLRILINDWLKIEKSNPDYFEIYRKYFSDKRFYRIRVKSKYFSKTGGKISKYDEQIKSYAEQLGWDWRLLASLIFQESQFNPNARSWAGASGLMQLMPATAKQFGAKNRKDPRQSLKAGVKYLKYLDNYWSKEISDESERINFILASYNIGMGHIEDARRLAKKFGANPNVWHDSVDKWLLNKSRRKYYSDPVVLYGYCSGEEPVNYVKEIFSRFKEYKTFIK